MWLSTCICLSPVGEIMWEEQKTWFHIKHIVLAKNTAGSMEENN